MGSGQRSEVNKLIRRHLRPQGFIVESDHGGHWTVTNPRIDPKRDGRRNSMTIPSSPGTSRGFLNIVARLRNELDFVWEGRGGNRGHSPTVKQAYQKRKGAAVADDTEERDPG